MKIPEIDRDLRDSDPRVRHWVMRLAEEHIALEQQNKEMTNIILGLVESFTNLHQVNIELNKRWERMRRGEQEPSMVESVLPEREN